MTAVLTPAETELKVVWVLMALMAGETFASHLHLFFPELSSDLWLIFVLSCLFCDAFVSSSLYSLDINSAWDVELPSKPIRKQLVPLPRPPRIVTASLRQEKHLLGKVKWL